MLRNKYVMGNWKMHGSKQTIHALLHEINSLRLSPETHAVVFPSYPYLEKTAWELRHSVVQWGAQNVSAHDEGAYTGEVSANMLKDMGCKYVLIGHSERREYFGETNEVVAQKFFQATKSGLFPVLCVGETLEEHRTHQTKQKILAQLKSVLEWRGAKEYLPQLIVAYEPVWAIGTGLTATPDEAQRVHAFIREIAAESGKAFADNLSILYGGSVKALNAKALFAMPDIDGGLVGGASLIGEEFKSICHAME